MVSFRTIFKNFNQSKNLLNYILYFSPLILVLTAIFVVQLILVKVFFTQDKGQSLALDNRYNKYFYILFFWMDIVNIVHIMNKKYIMMPFRSCFRRMYHVVSYFMFFPNIAVGIGSCVLRLLTSIVFGFVLISRMDRCMLIKGCESLDAGAYS